MDGLVQIDGVNYIERAVIIPYIIPCTGNGQVSTGSVVLPGTAKFWLKALTRQVIKANAVVSNGTCPFLFKYGNSDGSIWYTAQSVGGTTDRVLDSLIFGTAQFPYVILPHIVYTDTASIKWEFQDVSNNANYDVYLAFHGSWLFQA